MLSIEIYSDLICPWCFIGKRRLDRVLKGLSIPVRVQWRAYQLRPGLPEEGLDRVQYVQQRYGADADPGRMPERLAEEAAIEDIVFDYAKALRVPNTRAGHRLMAAAGSTPLQHELADRLFQAYFQQGRDIGDQETLLAIAEETGLDAALAREALAAPRWLEQVNDELEAARSHDVSGVPCLIFAGRFALPGVQADDVLNHFIERAAQRLAS